STYTPSTSSHSVVAECVQSGVVVVSICPPTQRSARRTGGGHGWWRLRGVYDRAGGTCDSVNFFDVGHHPCIEDHLPVAGGIKAAIEVEIGTTEVQPDLFGHLLQRVQALRE